MRLSEIKVRKAAPREKPYKLSDGRGLHLLVTRNGAKYWRVQYRIGGKQKLLALGVYPDVSLEQARERREEARKLIANGRDPMEVKRERQRLAKVRSEDSFERIAREWHAQQQGRWTGGHASCVIQSLEKDIFPLIGAKPIHEITAPAILEALRRIERRNALDVASRVLQRVNAVYRYAISTGRISYNPAADLVGSLKTRKVTHREAFPR
jgi:hypothetical protein